MFNCKSFVALCVGIMAVTAVHAQNTPRIDQREANQQTRIDRGVNSGSLTQREATKLQNQQNRINTAEANAKADGKVTAQERRQINRKQNRANRDIYRKKHNARTAN